MSTLLTPIDALPYAMAWLDENWNVTEANLEFHRLFRAKSPPQLSLRQQFGDLLKESTEPIRHECSWETLHDGLRDFKIDLRRSSERQGILFTAIDISDERKRARELEKTHSKVVGSARLAVLSEMAGGIAHEVNNPLAIIQGLAHQLLVKSKAGSLEPEFLKEKIEKIVETARRINRIIQGLRAFARDTENEPLELVRLRNIVDDTMILCAEKIRKQGITVHIADDFPDVEIECHPTQISQVLLNLLNNAYDAIHHLDGMTQEKWIRIEAKATPKAVELAIIDSGAGVAEDIRDKIHLPFFTTKEVGVGTGLGLSISKGIVDHHHGVLKLDANSKATRFVVLLPLVQEKQPAFKVRHTA
jgi:C4-dicarboxylate-specific signal transduction histidine kinase